MNPTATDRPRLSVVIPSHSRADLLARCLHSLAQHAPSGVEIIVVDDGSTDSIVSREASRHPGVIVLRNPRPLGFCLAANRGIMSSTGEIVELLNDDARVSENWAGPALRHFEDPAVGAVAPLVLIDGQPATAPLIDSAGDEYDLGGFARKRGHRQPLDASFLQRREVFGASGSSAFYRGELVRRLGGYPGDFGSYFEDVDLAWRINHAGFRTIFEPDSVVWHRVGSSHQRRRRLLEQQSRNEERVYWRNVPNLGAAFPRHLATLAGKTLRRIREGNFWPFAFGRLRAWWELRNHFEHRRAINISGR